MGNKRTPEIRFAGFTGDWEERKLGEVYTERKERGHESLPILSVSIHHGVSNGELDSNTLGKNVRRSEDKSLYKHVYLGDLVFNMMRAWQGAIGVVKSEGMVSPAYITALPSAELYPLFMDYCLRRNETIIQMDNLSYGVTDFRKRLYWDSFINVLCRIPSVLEQERITAFFNQLDNLIDINQQELTSLKQTKQGFLQKMFPREEESVPEVRFPGFSGAWEQRKVSTFSEETYGGGTPQTSNEAYWDGEIPWIQSSDLKEHEVFGVKPNKRISQLGLKNSATKLVPANSIAIITRVGVGKLAFMPFEYATSQDFLSLGNLKIDGWFAVYSLYKKLQSESHAVQGTSIKGITKDELLSKSVMAPASTAEQAKVGSLFQKLDHLITLHQRELDALKETKKAFLQKMFV